MHAGLFHQRSLIFVGYRCHIWHVYIHFPLFSGSHQNYDEEEKGNSIYVSSSILFLSCSLHFLAYRLCCFITNANFFREESSTLRLLLVWLAMLGKLTMLLQKVE